MKEGKMIYVDELTLHQYYQRNRSVNETACNMVTDGDLSELREMAKRINIHTNRYCGWPYAVYILTTRQRQDAIKYGATEVTRERLKSIAMGLKA
jgi:predicted adenine nucleotide alpha hydrolase (AANH) superfamily ATPase